MDRIQLVKPSMDYAEDLWAFRREIMESGDADSFAGCSGLENAETPAEWLAHIEQYGSADTCPADKVPSDVYLAVRCRDHRIVGIIDLRHHIDHPILGLWGGHIGYSIRPCERGQGYGREMLRLNLENCRRLGLRRVMITCHSGNIASERVILANGGALENEILVDGAPVKRYWITL